MKDHEIAEMVNDIAAHVNRLVDGPPQCIRTVISNRVNAYHDKLAPPDYQTLLREMCSTDPFHTWAIFPDTTHDGKDQWACARIGDSVFELSLIHI